LKFLINRGELLLFSSRGICRRYLQAVCNLPAELLKLLFPVKMVVEYGARI
jgi:hypothetical protein